MTNNNHLKIYRSLSGLFLCIVIICLLFILRKSDGAPLQWWEYGDMLLLFLGAFLRLVACLFADRLPTVSHKLNICAVVSLIGAVIWFTVTYFLMNS